MENISGQEQESWEQYYEEGGLLKLTPFVRATRLIRDENEAVILGTKTRASSLLKKCDLKPEDDIIKAFGVLKRHAPDFKIFPNGTSKGTLVGQKDNIFCYEALMVLGKYDLARLYLEKSKR